MNTENHEKTNPVRPLRYWMRAVDELVAHESALAFEREGFSRRDWMMLSRIARTAGDPTKADRRDPSGKRRARLADLGWAHRTDDGSWELTADGRDIRARLGAIVDGIRGRVAGAVPADDLAVTTASLEAIAREFGWTEAWAPTRRDGMHRRGPRHGHGHGHFDHAHGCADRHGA